MSDIVEFVKYDLFIKKTNFYLLLKHRLSLVFKSRNFLIFKFGITIFKACL